MVNQTIFVCGSYDLITLIGDSILKTSYNVIFLSCDKPKKITFKQKKIIYVENQKKCEEIILLKSRSSDDFLISSYWPWKFTETIVSKFKQNSVNFHPSPLPRDRGWFPHVHQIRNNEISGVTLHVIDEKLDKGKIWAQERFKLPYPLTSGEAHNILKKEIVSLFNKNWKNIYTSKLKPFAQKKGGNFHSKFALDTPEAISIKKGSSEDILLRKIASRNFKSKSFIKIKIDKNTEKYIHLQFSDEGDLSNPE